MLNHVLAQSRTALFVVVRVERAVSLHLLSTIAPTVIFVRILHTLVGSWVWGGVGPLTAYHLKTGNVQSVVTVFVSSMLRRTAMNFDEFPNK